MIIHKKLYINPMVDLSYVFRRFHEILRDEYNSFREYCTFVSGDNYYIIYNPEDLNISIIKLSFLSDYPPAKSILGFKCDDSTYYLSNPGDADIAGVVHIFVKDCQHYDCQQEELNKLHRYTSSNSPSEPELRYLRSKDPENVLGHALLENREDGVYYYGSFNEKGQQRMAKALVAYNEIWDNIFKKDSKSPALIKVISSGPATIAFWDDGTKTVVKCQEGDTYDLEKGILYAIIRKVYGESRNYTNILNVINESCETYNHTKANEAFWNYGKEEVHGI